MTTNVIMPQLGESIVEGTIIRWLVREGEAVKKFEPLLEIATDKVDTEAPSPADGVLLKILAAEGATVAVGTPIGVIGAAGEEVADALAPTPAAPAEPTSVPAPSPAPAPAASQPSGSTRESGFVSPIVARLAAEHGVELSKVAGSGLKGRVTKKDILSYIARGGAGSEAEEMPGSDADQQKNEEIVPLSRMRRLIAEHMVASKRTSPHVTTVFNCDMTAVVRHRYAHKTEFAGDGAELTFTPYFVAAIVAALKQHPGVNASWSEAGIVRKRGIHVGVAVAVAEGLLVPVIKHADSLNLLGLTRAVNDLARRARGGELAPDELQGGTFTLTNHGASGSLFATPIINQPQTGILGVGKIHKAPVVVGGHPLLPDAGDSIAIRPIAYLSFTFDHRILDGASADAFVGAVKGELEGVRLGSIFEG